MSVKMSGPAGSALRQQVEFLGEGQVSLDSLWRAWGSPRGHDPRSWSELAAPLLSGFAAYRGNLDGTDPSVEAARLLWIWEEESKDPWRSGDLMSHEFIAWAYATYLDTSFGSPSSPRSPSLACR